MTTNEVAHHRDGVRCELATTTGDCPHNHVYNKVLSTPDEIAAAAIANQITVKTTTRTQVTDHRGDTVTETIVRVHRLGRVLTVRTPAGDIADVTTLTETVTASGRPTRVAVTEGHTITGVTIPLDYELPESILDHLGY